MAQAELAVELRRGVDGAAGEQRGALLLVRRLWRSHCVPPAMPGGPRKCVMYGHMYDTFIGKGGKSSVSLKMGRGSTHMVTGLGYGPSGTLPFPRCRTLWTHMDRCFGSGPERTPPLIDRPADASLNLNL
eukprot:9503022-Pyramimonas_sp.AAC.1